MRPHQLPRPRYSRTRDFTKSPSVAPPRRRRGGAKVDHPHRRGSCDAVGKRSSGGAMATKSPPQPILTATGADFDRHRRCPHHAPQPPLPSLLPRSLAPFHLARSRSRSRRPRERLVIGGRARLAGQKSDAGTPGTAPAIARGQSLIIRHRAHHVALPRSAPASECLTRGIRSRLVSKCCLVSSPGSVCFVSFRISPLLRVVGILCGCGLPWNLPLRAPSHPHKTREI